MYAIDELQCIRCFDSGDAYNEVLKPLKKPRFLEKELIERKSKVCGYFVRLYATCVGPVAKSVQRLTTGWTVWDRIPMGTRFSARPDWPWGPPNLL